MDFLMGTRERPLHIRLSLHGSTLGPIRLRRVGFVRSGWLRSYAPDKRWLIGRNVLFQLQLHYHAVAVQIVYHMASGA
jgi:hypothetical protein